jgi:hypothetical protein
MIFEYCEDADLYFGINTGFFMIGILFYIIGLTGPHFSVRSLLYLFTNFTFWITVLMAFFINRCDSNSCQLKYHIGQLVAMAGDIGYMVILAINTNLILERKWIIMLGVLALPSIVSIETWGVVHLLELINIKTYTNLGLIGEFGMILACFFNTAVNLLCFWRFLKYKQLAGLKMILIQYLMGAIFSLIIEISLIAMHFIFDYPSIMSSQMGVATFFINLNIEYFVLYQSRIIILTEIQSYNS